MLRPDGSRVHVQYALERTDMSPDAAFIYIELAARPEEDDASPEETASGAALTRREREVIQLIALGGTGPDIAQELFLSHDTVRTHVRNAMMKTGARTRAQLVAIMMREGFA
jgi:DNA-binding NarL/FixJ family response regulator